MPAVRVNTPPVTHVNTSQPGARSVPTPKHIDLGTKMGATSHPHGPGVGNPRHGAPTSATVATTVVRKVPPQAPQRQRAGVAPRPSQGGIVRPGGNPGTTVRVIVPELAPIVEVAPAITPLTLDEMMFLSYLVDGFLVSQNEIDPSSKRIAIASSAKIALETWMGAVTDGSAKIVSPPAPAQTAPVVTPVTAAPASSSAPVVMPAAPAATPTHPTGASE